jgi:hypothetical protein
LKDPQLLLLLWTTNFCIHRIRSFYLRKKNRKPFGLLDEGVFLPTEIKYT